MAKIEEGGDDFMMRVMGMLAETGQRQLQKIDPKKIKEMVSELQTLKDEQSDAQNLQVSQEAEYNEEWKKIVSYLDTISSAELIELPQDIKLEIENVDRKIKKKLAEEAAAAAAEEAAPEPE